MGLITKEVEILLTNNLKHYEDLGYKIPRDKNKQGKLTVPVGSKILVKVNDLPRYSRAKVNIECDNCGCELLDVDWENYLTSVREDGKYYCRKCANIIFGKNKFIKTKLSISKSFEDWCKSNLSQADCTILLNRWNYNLNNCKPSEILYSTGKQYWFNCNKGIHKPELKRIRDFTNNRQNQIDCKQCNSFAQWGIDHLKEDFLEKYWDWEKNIVDPWGIDKSSHKSVWIKCQEKDYHGSYPIICNNFVNGNRCIYCGNYNTHCLDSLGTLHPEVINLWSDKNNKSPYEYTPKSGQEVYWKCLKGHEDYLRSIGVSNVCDFRCPECQYSKGEEKISNCFMDIGFIKINDGDYKILDDNFKEKYKYYIPQKKFDGLVGLGNGLLSYDFYLPQYNLLIEYQGKQHYEPIDFAGKGEEWALEQFQGVQIRDQIKRDYCKKNNIILIEIPYWDYNNIESILSQELNLTIPINL